MSRSRNLASIRSRLTRKLTTYSAALSAGLVAGNQASANVVYIDLGTSGFAFDGDFDLDLNADDQIDFHLGSTSRSSTYFNTFGMGAVGQSANGVFKNEQGSYGLAEGESIDPTTTQLATNFAPLVSCNSSFSGWHWKGPFVGSPGFLGLAFDIPNSGRHAAWVQIEVLNEGVPTNQWPCSWGQAVVFGYAYETIPGKPILAGDTGVIADHFGDTNADGKVDILDLNNVRNNFGATGDGVLGDTNSDDVVDIEDLNAVRNNFGAENPVPEPPSLVLLAAGAAGLAILRRRRATRRSN